ncbi:MAG: aminoglycoside phosphotransferase family protein [Chloroflexota bacterium]|nr:aminoglycoside phosphotransferase family protein [Chloroflexota bacterium]
MSDQPIDHALVRRLLAAQFPQWAELPLRPVPSDGTDNIMFRLGDDMCVRVPQIARAVPNISKEQYWLLRIAPHLPLRVPRILGEGRPAAGFPWVWSVVDWIDGEEASLDRLADPLVAAATLGEFLLALRRIDASDAPRSGPETGGRGLPLCARDGLTRRALRAMAAMPQLDDLLELPRLERIWDDAQRLPEYEQPPRWCHFDLHAGNMLALDGRLSAVIDWGMAGAGDPAAELHVAWGWATPDAREVLRDAAEIDQHTWARGRAWALSIAVIQIAYYLPRGTHPVLVDNAVKSLSELSSDSA